MKKKISVIGVFCLLLLSLTGVICCAAENTNNCSKMSLPIETTYSAQNQSTHPSMVTFKNKWNGYKYWFSFTPYPFADGTFENPFVVATNNLKDFELPKGASNPIASLDETNCDELKDANLLYREDTDTLECWYLGRINSSINENGNLVLFRKTTKDGVIWSKYEIMNTFTDVSIVSPTVIFEDGQYKLWGFAADENGRQLLYMDSKNGTDWSDFKECSVPNISENYAWHGSVTKINGKYTLVYVGNEAEGKDNIFYSTSQDGMTFNKSISIVKNNVGWKFLYRPFLIYENNTYYLYYGTTSFDNHWGISLSSGANVNDLKPVEIEDTKVSFKEDLYVKTLKRQVSYIIKTINLSFSVMVVVLTFVSSMIIIVLLSLLRKWQSVPVVATIFAAICSFVLVYVFNRAFNSFLITSLLVNGLISEAIVLPISLLVKSRARK